MSSFDGANGLSFDFDQQSEMLSRLERLIAETAESETNVTSEHTRAVAEVERQHATTRQQLAEAYRKRSADLRAEYDGDREATIFDYESDAYELVQHHDHELARFDEERATATQEAKQRYKLAKKATAELHSSTRARAEQQLAAIRQQCEQRWQAVSQPKVQTEQLLRRRRCLPAEQESPQPNDRSQQDADRTTAELDAADSCPAVSYEEACGQIQSLHRQLEMHGPARFLEQHWPLLIFVFTWFASAYPFAHFLDFNALHWPVATTAAAAAIALAVRTAVRPFVLRQARSVYPRVRQLHQVALDGLEAEVRAAEAEKRQRDVDADRQRDESIRAGRQLRNDRLVEIEAHHVRRVDEENAVFEARDVELIQVRDRRLKETEAWLPANQEPLTANYRRQLEQLDGQHAQRLRDLQRRFTEQWAELSERWRSGVAEFQNKADAAAEFCDERFPPWNDPGWEAPEPPVEEPPILPFGWHRFHINTLTSQTPRSEQLRLDWPEYKLPAVLQFPSLPSLLFEAEGTGREDATRAMQNVMLRTLTALPPAKARFTIIDPVGLGQNFSAFMHLTDFDEKLVANRIWTEANHIQKRLTDLTEHMENVIQSYLRNEFDSIHEYNRAAGEVAEPFQILVIANFPAGFNDEAARRLLSIASSGARCGVYTLISVDRKMKLPRNFEIADLERHALTLRWNGERFETTHPRMRHLPLSLDAPPDVERFTEIVRRVGALAKDASRVEVPFSSVTATANQWWSRDSRRGVEVALGRAGATKLQEMRLGSGTSQHVLIAGKTGSGKSTLLNAMIVNLGVWYSPEEIEFYLIDFKKGVEFKPYATYALPHARVIAIESEREFGMSVLERLDAELRSRGDLFRKDGVQNLAAWRDANPDALMPRLLLVIDEFQEFFVKEDKLAADASLLLDRLVRQGRAFGIHVLLGSQTLAGAYSLARSTLGQMAVRIALQCSESDAHLILSEGNTAARLLNRPGEAIYNDANGLFEGNHPFQVVWLSDHEREHYLQRIGELAKIRSPRVAPPIVFEGNQPADPAENRLLADLLSNGRLDATTALAPRAWLGAAVAIKEPTSVVFHRQSGANLLVVGPQEELAVGVLANSVLSLAAHYRSPGDGTVRKEDQPASSPSDDPAGFIVLDGLRSESAAAGCWQRVADQLPLPVALASTGREALPHIAELSQEVARRVQAGDESAPARFLVIANLSRFRELQKGEEFGFSSFGEEDKPDPAKQFREILRDGPSVGVHTLIWADSFHSASRWLDRQALQNFHDRVLFQMGASDSSNLMDSTAAAQLGPFRAILNRHDLGEVEKFRPYALPTSDWIRRFGKNPDLVTGIGTRYGS